MLLKVQFAINFDVVEVEVRDDGTEEDVKDAILEQLSINDIRLISIEDVPRPGTE